MLGQYPGEANTEDLALHAERAGGVGLGLALVRQIAERHGGTVRCLARGGGGSCFVITLPCTAVTAAVAGQGAPGRRSG